MDAVIPRHSDGGNVVVIAPRTPDNARPGQWFPHPFLDPAVLAARSREIDAIHLHFGFEHRTLEEIRAFVTACRESCIDLLLTVHDLDNPHLLDQAPHHARLAELILAASHVVTLTASAAREIMSRYGRRAEVIPHPFVVDPALAADLVARRVPHRDGHRVCVFLKDIRANTVTDPAFYADLHREAPDADLAVFAHRRAGDHPLVVDVARALPSGLQLHDRMSDERLYDTLAGFDVAVLPYLRGSHSGWLEMCRDLGVTVVAPDCGHYAGQSDRQGAVELYATGDGASAARAVSRAMGSGRLPFGGDRRAQHQRILQAHRVIYHGSPGSCLPPPTAASPGRRP